jgi:hypothetical protein
MELPPALGPVGRDLARRDVHQRPTGERLEVRQRRQLPGGAVHRVLDQLIGDVDLLDPPGRQIQQLG